MSAIQNIVVTGAALSALYVLIAIGFTLIFSIGGIVNLAHGAFIMLGAYGVFFMVGGGVPLTPSVVISAGFVFVVAILLFRVFFEPIREEPLTALMVTLLVAFIIEELVGIFVTHETRSVPSILSGIVQPLGVTIPLNRVLAFFVSWVLIVGLWYFVNRTQFGQAMLAVSIDRKGAASLGIDVTRIDYAVWGIAGTLAAISGYFLGAFTGLNPQMGFDPLLIAFVIVVIGGLGSITGSLVAAYIVGLLETAAAFLIAPSAQGLFSFGLLILFMLYRPEGLFGKREVEF
jgi:branched-chain amino acid transport system permease protein